MKGTIKVVFFFGMCLVLNDWVGILTDINTEMSLLKGLILPFALLFTYIVFKQIKHDGKKVNMLSFVLMVIVVFHLVGQGLKRIWTDTAIGGVIFTFLLFIIGLPVSIIIANKVCSYMKKA